MSCRGFESYSGIINYIPWSYSSTARIIGCLPIDKSSILFKTVLSVWYSGSTSRLEDKLIKYKYNMNYTQSIGNITELLCIAKFIELGYEVSIPYGNNAKYDFIADINGQMIRIQCKSCSNPPSRTEKGKYDLNAITINTTCSTTNTKKTARHNYSKEQIDYFATYYQNQVYLIPVEECSTQKTLRFVPPSNGNNNYNKAEDYKIEKFIPYSQDYLLTKDNFINLVQSQKTQDQAFCSICGKEIGPKSISGMCRECYNKSTRIVERPTREELKQMIKEESFVAIGKKFNVTDNAVRKWCELYHLPRTKKEINQYSELEWSNI